MELPQNRQPLDDELPRTIGIRVDFTLAVLGSAARSVEQLLCAAGNRANSTINVEVAVTTTRALFGKQPLFFQNPDKGGVDPRQYGYFSKPPADSLDSCPTGKR
jgi:hypothetical protein